jgi:sRNA-binding protein
MTNVETTDKTGTVAEQATHVAPEKASSKKASTKKAGAPKAAKAPKGAKAAAPKKGAKAAKKAAKPAPAKKARAPRAESKKAEVLELMRRAKGATLAEIAASTGWQKHTIRGFVSILGSKHGVKIESAKNAAGERTYRIAK